MPLTESTLTLIFPIPIQACFHYWQQTGEYFCKSVYVQWNDIYNPDLATLSGLYSISCKGVCERPGYLEKGHGNRKGTAKFFYCDDEEVWIFAYGDPSTFTCESALDPEDSAWKAKSSKIDHRTEASYDFIASAKFGWFARHHDITSPLPSMTIKCYDCRFNGDLCGKHGRCVVSKQYMVAFSSICFF